MFMYACMDTCVCNTVRWGKTGPIHYVYILTHVPMY